MKKILRESFELIRKKALFNQENRREFFVALCTELKTLEQIARENLVADDPLIKEIMDLINIICKT
jgi:hypothetical protein